MAIYDIHWQAPLVVGTTVDAGQAVLPKPDGTWVVATSANRALYGRTAGVVLVGANSESPAPVAVTGIVDKNITGLGTGTASWVRVDADGALERCTPSGADDIVGYCRADGTLHASFGWLTADIVNGGGSGGGLSNWFDVTDYGATGDGTTDDTTAINAAIAAANAAGEGTVYFPAGDYKVTSTLTRPSGGIWLLGVNPNYVASAGSVIQQYHTGTGIYLSEENDANSSRRSGIENLAFRMRVDQTGLTATIIGATNATPIVITTSANHGFSSGQIVHQRGVGGNDAANGIFSITVLSPTTYSLQYPTSLANVAGTGAYTSGGVAGNRSLLMLNGAAAVEIRGGTKFNLKNMRLYDYPIGICLDGAEETEIDRISISGVGGGYTGQTTAGFGIWFVDADSRGKGFTFSGTTNQIVVRNCLLEGLETSIYDEGGVGHFVKDCNFQGGTNAILLGAPQLVTYQNVTCEGYSTGRYVRVDHSCAPSQITFDQCFFGGSTVSLDVSAPSASISQLAMRNVRFGGPNGGSAIVGANRISQHHIENCWCPQVNVAFADGEFAGAGVGVATRDALVSPKGLRINSGTPSQAVVHGSMLSYGDDLIRVDNGSTQNWIRHRTGSTRREQSVELNIQNASTNGNTSGHARFLQSTSKASGSASSTLFSWPFPDESIALIRWTVLQHGATSSNRAIWVRSRRAYRDGGGAITFFAAAADDETPDVTGLAITAPDVSDDGSRNLVLTVYSDAGLDTYVTAHMEIIVGTQ